MYYSYVYRLLRIKILFGVILLYPNLLEAQAPSPVQWSVDGNIRYRFEKWDNRNAKSYGSFPTIGKSDDKILLQRIIAGTTLQYNQKITLSAHLQDSRAFGWSLRNEKEPDAFKIHPENNTDSYYIMNPQEEFFEIFDASIRIDSIFQWVSVIAGRQKIAYGDYRVFGPGSWGNTGRWTWDAIRIMADKDKWSGGIWLGGTKINDPKRTYLPFTHTEYFGGGAHGNIHLARFLNADFYLAHKHQGSAEYIRDQHINRNWVGFRLFNPESRLWQYELNSTYEFGKENSERINAYGFSLKLGYQFSEVAWKPCLTIRYTYASGNNLETENEEKFDPVFGAADRYYGWMNLVKWSNLDDREIMLELYPLKGIRIELKYNRLYIPQPDQVKVNGDLTLLPGKKHLGDELNLFAKYDLNENWQFVSAFGYFMLKDARTPELEDPGNALWVALQVLYRFKIQIP